MNDIKHEGLYGTGKVAVVAKDQARIFFGPQDFGPCIVNAIAYNGVFDVKNEGGFWVSSCNVMDRVVSTGSYEKDKMSFKNREKVGTYYVGIIQDILRDDPSLAREAEKNNLSSRMYTLNSQIERLEKELAIRARELAEVTSAYWSLCDQIGG